MKNDKGIIPGDIIRAYHKGFHRVLRVEKRSDASPLVYYVKELDSNFKPCKRKEMCCDVLWCEKITLDSIKKEIELQCAHFRTGLERVKELLNKG